MRPLAIGAAIVAAFAAVAAARAWARRRAGRLAHALRRDRRRRIDRYKFTRKSRIRAALLADVEIAGAVDEHVRATGESEADAWEKVHDYVEEIVPSFNLLSYYRLGYGVARILIPLLYKVSVGYEARAALDAIPRDSVVIYLMNHRSNADYVVVAYVLSGEVAISYAVGEWARVWPLETVFKSFGSYFVRRRYREALYHKVLERYVQLITRNGVTQGVFLEGGSPATAGSGSRSSASSTTSWVSAASRPSPGRCTSSRWPSTTTASSRTARCCARPRIPASVPRAGSRWRRSLPTWSRSRSGSSCAARGDTDASA